jgi:2-iminobutanoate/2-iminopropanoate deaminase
MTTQHRENKRRPPLAEQHVTAGPYSPVLEVDARRLVVISGQVAVALDGSVVGRDVREQTIATLENCRRHLAAAGCDFADVFKVNAYLASLEDWAAFNEVYATTFPPPLPVRTTIQAILLPGFLVEIELWAAKSEDD